MRHDLPHQSAEAVQRVRMGQARPAEFDVGDAEGDLLVKARSPRATVSGPPTRKLIGWAQRSRGSTGSGVAAGILPSSRNRRQRVRKAGSALAKAVASSGPTWTGRFAAIRPVPPAER